MRACIIAVIDTKFGEVEITSLHLTPYREELRLAEIKLILARQTDHKQKILMGDLNSLSMHDGYPATTVTDMNETQRTMHARNGKLCFDVTKEIEVAGYVDTAVLFHQQQLPTVPTSSSRDIAHAKMRLDYVFASELLKDKIVGYTVVRNGLSNEASDHYPVVVDVHFE